jgi:hypothetical protein
MVNESLPDRIDPRILPVLAARQDARLEVGVDLC